MDDHAEGVVTFFFSDIEGSTRLELEHGTETYLAIRQLQRRILRQAFGEAGGVEQGTEGDSFFVIFDSPASAVAAAVAGQRGLAAASWPAGATVRIRMGLHSGAARLSDDGTFGGLDINRAARIAGAAHGEQIVLSDATRTLVADSLPADLRLVDLGRHGLKDLPEPEHLFQLAAPDLRREFPPLRSIDTRAHHLPAHVTSFIGREDEIAEVRALLERARLVTLTGPGGTGKTRLASAVAHASLGDFADGVTWVDLGPVTDPALVVVSIATALGLRDEGVVSLVDAVAGALAQRDVLLVTDNFEQVLAAAPLVSELLERAPRLRVLVTSRTLLRLRGEHEYSVPPLAVPDPGHLPPFEMLAGHEAIALFVDRARTARPDFDLTPDVAPDVVRICARLDGLPLAIELAAARVRLLRPSAILARLEDALGLRGGPDLPARQQTLRGAIAWSYDLLDDVERVVFARFSVFAGRPQLDAAIAVCDPEGSLGLDLLDVLGSLAEKSLLKGPSLDDEEPRFRMLQVIREFGHERLVAAGEEELVRERHLRFHADLAERAEPHLTAVDAVPWLDRLEVDHDDIRAALAWAMEHGELEAGLAAAGRLWRFWHQRGRLREGLAITLDLLARAQPDAPTAGRALALEGAGGLAYWQNDFPAAERHYAAALDIHCARGDVAGEAGILHSLGYLAAIDGDRELARVRFDKALAGFRSVGDRRMEGRLLNGMALVATLDGNFGETRRLVDEALPIFRQSDDRFGLANALGIIGRAELEAGFVGDAASHIAEALRQFAAGEDVTGVSMELDDLGALAFRTGESARAVRLAGAAEAIRERVGGGAPRNLVLPIAYVDEARATLDPSIATRAWQEGRALSTEAAIELALGESSADPAGVG